MAVIGYARVSTADQNPQLQLDALQEAGAHASLPTMVSAAPGQADPSLMRAWTISGKAMSSRSGSWTGLAATLNTFSRCWTNWRRGGSDSAASLRGLNTEGPMGKAMLTIMAAFAELERDTMIERTRAGLIAAAANGRKGGRPRKVDDADAAKACQLRESLTG